MARVVTRRKTPPYLMIVFAVLFVIATGAAIMLYLEMDKAQQDLKIAQSNVSELDDKITDLQKNQSELARLITGQSNLSFEQVLTAIKEGYKKRDAIADNIKQQYSSTGMAIDKTQASLIDDMNVLATQYQTSAQNLAQANSQIASKNDEVAQEQAAKKALVTKHGEDLESLKTQLAAAQKARDDAQNAHTNIQNQTKEEMAKNRDDLQKKITELDTKLQDMMLKISEKNGEIAKLKQQMEILKNAGRDSVKIANKTDGRIEKMVSKDGICYISVGKKQGVKPGMTFAVYDRGSDSEAKPKGSLRVTGVHDTFSECKVLATLEENNPITTGDNVANIVFQTARTYTFVVEGLFDMAVDGRATQSGKEEVINTIRRFGGKVGDVIDYQTDYVILGEEPEKPQKPSGDASAATQEAYQEQLKRWQTYSNIRGQAEAQKIPILNKHRFLELTGYMPEKKSE